MSGIYIKGIKMPKACVYRENGHLITCPLYDIDGYCGALTTEASHKESGKLSDCPLVPVPDHGRLVDADKIVKENKDEHGHYISQFAAVIGEAVEGAPTVISADKENK